MSIRLRDATLSLDDLWHWCGGHILATQSDPPPYAEAKPQLIAPIHAYMFEVICFLCGLCSPPVVAAQELLA
jgi:hypothetical protein